MNTRVLMIKRYRMPFLYLSALSLLIAALSSATPISIAIHGSVVDLNGTSSMMIISPECQNYPCDYEVKGHLSGFVPDDAVFSRLEKGEVVEVVFKQWINQITDPDTGLLYPSDEVRDIHQWYTVQRLTYGDDGKTLRGTEIFGDPAYVRDPLAGDYELTYRLFGPDPRAYDFRSFPKETVANITLKKPASLNISQTLGTGETGIFHDERNTSSITIQFNGGYDAGFMLPKACPCADFHIQVLPDTDRRPVTNSVTILSSPSNASPVDPVPGILLLGIMAACCSMVKQR